MKGIDVSRHQGNIDWSKVKAAGIEFAIIRIGYGMYENQKDAQFENNYKGATNNGIPVGVYLYSYAKSVAEAEREADVCLKWLANRKLQLPVYFDIEDDSQKGLGKSTLDAMCRVFCNKIEKAGYWAGIYANKYWLTSLISGTELGKRYTVWVAQYANTCTYNGNYAIWQYTSDGKVNGIGGRVDMNNMVHDIIQRGGSKPASKPTPTPSKKSNEEIAQEVINGKWGNGNDRKSLLQKAGYDYSTIQKLVNQKLGVNKPSYKIYIVKKGDSLSKIAQKYGTTWQKIYNDNKSVIGSKPNLIKAGQKLIIK